MRKPKQSRIDIKESRQEFLCIPKVRARIPLNIVMFTLDRSTGKGFTEKCKTRASEDIQYVSA